MSEFTKGKWKAFYGEKFHGIHVAHADDEQGHDYGNGQIIAHVVRWNDGHSWANARLIAAAPEMYDWIEKTCRFLHDLKRYAQDEDEMRDHAEDLNATYNNLLTDAYLMLVRIDGEEAQS